MLRYVRRPLTPSDQLSIAWWRFVIWSTRWAAHALPVLLPLRPYWWLPVLATAMGFGVGFWAMILLA
jgi:hypothetical protein